MNYDPNTGEPLNRPAPVQNNSTNGFAIAGLVCSIVVGSITGIIFSAIGMSKAKELGNGKGMAIAGLVISIVRIAIIVLYLLALFVLWPTTKSTIVKNAHCSEAYACVDQYDGTLKCKYIDTDYSIKTVTCPSGTR